MKLVKDDYGIVSQAHRCDNCGYRRDQHIFGTMKCLFQPTEFYAAKPLVNSEDPENQTSWWSKYTEIVKSGHQDH
jgi:hypothetical protein